MSSLDSPVEEVRRPERSSRLFVLGLVALGIAVLAYFAFGMPGMDHSSETVEDEAETMDHTSMP